MSKATHKGLFFVLLVSMIYLMSSLIGRLNGTYSSNSFFSTSAFAAFNTQIDEPPVIIPLPQGCIDASPPNEQVPVCCISGFVYVNGQIVGGAEVIIESSQGQAIIYSEVHQGVEERPYYQANLNDAPLTVEPNDLISVTVRYSGLEKTVQHIVQVNGQQLDIVLSRPAPDALASIHRIPGTIGEKGKFYGPISVATDTLGNVYVLDLLESRVQIFDPEGNYLREWNKPVGNAPDEVAFAVSIDIDSKNNIYLVDRHNRRIQKFANDGTFQNVINHWNDPLDGRIHLFDDPVDVEIDKNDNIYIVDYRGNKIVKYNSRLNFVATWDIPEKIGTGIVGPFAVAIDGDGNAYVADWDGNRVLKFTNDYLSYEEWLPGTFNNPRDITIDEMGYIYILEYGKHHVRKFAPDGTLSMTWGGVPGDGDDQFNSPVSLAIHGDRAYVADLGNYRIQILDINNGFLGHWGEKSTGSAQVIPSEGYVVDPDYNLYIPDRSGHIVKLGPDGAILKSWGNLDFSSIPHAFMLPKEIALYGRDYLYMIDYSANYLDVFGVSGEDLQYIDSLQVSSPSGVAAGKTGEIYVASTGSKSLQVFKVESNNLITVTSIVSWTDISTGLTETFTSLYDVTVDTENNIYVADASSHRVIKFRWSNNTIVHDQTWSDDGSSTGLRSPVFIGADQRGYVYIAGDHPYIQKFDSNGNFLGTIGGNRGGPGQWGAIAPYFTFDKDNRMYVGRLAIEVFEPMSVTIPVATIVHIDDSATALAPGETFKVLGQGQSSDTDSVVEEYKWVLENTWQNHVLTFTTTIPVLEVTYDEKLSEGPYSVSLQVWNNGIGSAWTTVTDKIYVLPKPKATSTPTTTATTTATLEPGVTPSPTATPFETPLPSCEEKWTMLLYLVGDYNDNNALANSFSWVRSQISLRTNACVQVAIQADGPASIGSDVEDTRRWILQPGGNLEPFPFDNGLLSSEQQMDAPETLTNFVRWGQQSLPAAHYYLAIANHAQAVQGIGWDISTGTDKFLTVNEISQALKKPGIAPIDVIHLDGCSMSTLEVAFQLRDVTKYLIASQYLAWSFFAYDDYMMQVTDHMSAEYFAKSIVERYYTYAQSARVPATLAALNLERVSAVKEALNDVVVPLKAWLAMNPQPRRRTLYEIRRQTQSLDSNNDFINNALDEYVDLLDWAKRIRDASSCVQEGDGSDMVLPCDAYEKVDNLIRELEGTFEDSSIVPFVRENQVLSNEVPLHYIEKVPQPYRDIIFEGHVHGVSIYYPCLHIDENGNIPPDLKCVVVNEDMAIAAADPITYTTVYRDYVYDEVFDFTLASYWNEFLITSGGAPERDTPDDILTKPTGPLAPYEALPKLDAVQHSDLQIDRDQNGIISPGDTLHFTTVITNQNVVTATSVVLTQSLSNGVWIMVEDAVEVMSDSASMYMDIISDTAIISVGDILPNTVAVVEFDAQLTPELPTYITRVPSQAFVKADKLPISQPVADPTGKKPGVLVAPKQYLLFLPIINQ
ncbi:MAG: hypothetical protein KDE46_00235 [Caldilineaceae bacterium]|nr:hypothetical protein [Caldilineaceae bacterium]